jgi:hypothetical protein
MGAISYDFFGYGYIELAGFGTTITTPMQIEYGNSFDTEVEGTTSSLAALILNTTM